MHQLDVSILCGVSRPVSRTYHLLVAQLPSPVALPKANRRNHSRDRLEFALYKSHDSIFVFPRSQPSTYFQGMRSRLSYLRLFCYRACANSFVFRG